MKDLSKCTHLRDGTELDSPPIRSASSGKDWRWSAVVILNNSYQVRWFNDEGRASFGGYSNYLALPIDWVYVVYEPQTLSTGAVMWEVEEADASHRINPDNPCVLIPREKWDAEDE